MPVSEVAAVAAVVVRDVAAKGHVIGKRKVLHGAPWQIVVFSMGFGLMSRCRQVALAAHRASYVQQPMAARTGADFDAGRAGLEGL